MFLRLIGAFAVGFLGISTQPEQAPAVAWDSLEPRLNWEAKNGFAGVLLIARDGNIVLHKAYGLANRDKQIAITPDTIFGIGSTPIDFTKAAILLLAERGKLKLSDSISKYFDNVPDDMKAITIQFLMTGRSGLRNFHDLPADRDPDHAWIDRAEAVRRILDQKLLFLPGSNRQHSHSAWGLLAAIIEIVSGQTYLDFMRENLFKPAGMNDTGFFGDRYAEDRMAIGYGLKKDGEVNAPPYWGKTSWLVMGSGGQVSTAMDMWRWQQAIYGGKLLTPDSVKLYAESGQGMLVGGDMYGFEIMYAGNARSMMVVMSNVASSKTRPQLERLGQALTALVTDRKVAKFSLGIKLEMTDEGQVKIAEVIAGGAAQRDGLRDGDLVISAAGQALGNEPLSVLAPLLEKGEPIAFEIERAGKRLTVTVKPAPKIPDGSR
jgi:CubicO group peptidase (beta-lactamase class C family)